MKKSKLIVRAGIISLIGAGITFAVRNKNKIKSKFGDKTVIYKSEDGSSLTISKQEKTTLLTLSLFDEDEDEFKTYFLHEVEGKDEDTLWYGDDEGKLKISVYHEDGYINSSRIYFANKDVEDSKLIIWHKEESEESCLEK